LPNKNLTVPESAVTFDRFLLMFTYCWLIHLEIKI